MRKILLGGMALGLLAGPALAATEFYVAQDVATKKCAVVDKKPDGQTMTERDGKVYASKEEAEAAMTADAECVK